jgi:hypothetical protein
MMFKYFFGLDLGQNQDYSALSIMECVNKSVPSGIDYIKGYRPPPADPAKNEYHLGHLERFDLGTSYMEVVKKVSAIFGKEPFKNHAKLIIDVTGVGDAIFDMFTAAGLKPIGVFFTGGNTAGRSKKFYTVPTRDLVFTLLALFERDRFKIAAGLSHANILVNELLNFRVKINEKTGHDSYSHWREKDHDDLLYATAVAVWYAQRQRPGARLLPKPKGF